MGRRANDTTAGAPWSHPVRGPRRGTGSGRLEPTFESGRWSVEFRPRGAGRYLGAGFLAVWLCGWAAGEVFALGALLAMGGSVVAPDALRELGLGRVQAPEGGAWFAIVFLLVWVSFWTVGGIAAMRELLRLLWTSDRIAWDGAGIELVQRVGPFASRRTWSAAEVRDVTLRRPRRNLEILTARGAVALTALGTRDELARLRDLLRGALGLGTRAAAPPGAVLPAEWEAEPADDGSLRLVRPRAARRRGATIAWVVTGALALLAGFAFLAPRMNGEPVPGGAGAAGFAALVIAVLGLGSAWLSHGGSEIRVRHGALTFRRWFLGREWVETLEPARLEIERSTDGDGDEWLALRARLGRRSRVIERRMNDPDPVLALGRWIASRASVPLDLPRGLDG